MLRLASRYQLGRSRVLGMYDLAAAIEHFDIYLAERAAASDRLPSIGAAHWRRGNALEALDRIEEARVAYRRAVEADPELEEAGRSLRALGKR